MLPEFVKFPKIPRFNRDTIVTEKLDGTNGQIYVTGDGRLYAGSRKRWLTLDDDHYGFCRWAMEHRDELVNGLGPGHHFGEWWGQGINRNYGLKERRYSLFNVSRWPDGVRPACCHAVPILWQGRFEDLHIPSVMCNLEAAGSVAAPGFMKPEGIIVFHSAAGKYFKKTFYKDDVGKDG